MNDALLPVLTPAETDFLAECEVVIERGMGVFVEVGEALIAVRDSRLYRAEFSTFEDYCRDRWGMDRSYANRLIDSARVVELISSPIGAEINSDDDEPDADEPAELLVPATESQARELAPLLDDPEELREVWTETVARTEGKPTAAAIREVRRERSGEPPAPLKPSVQDEGDARRDAELDAEMEDTAVRFRRNFSTAMRRATEIWTFDAARIAEVYAQDFDSHIERTFIHEMNAFCDRITEAHRARQRAGLRLITGDAS